jgi:RHS repeat-associated protein
LNYINRILDSLASPADLTKSYVYDGLGRRTLEKTRDLAGNLTAATAWIYDGEQIAYEQQLRLDGSGTAVIPYASILCALPEAALACRITTRWYTPSDVTDDMIAATPDVASAPAGTPISPTISGGGIPQGASSPSAASYAYHTDHQGSVRAITNDAGQIVNAYAYDAYGNAEEAVESLAQPYRYTGREWDGVTRLYHYRARAYDPETGRFLQEDPIGLLSGDANFYRYVKNNPVNFVDPSGLTAAGEEGSVDSIGTTATPGIFNTARQTACAFQTIAGILDVIPIHGVPYELELFTDADLGCGARAAGKSKMLINFDEGRDAEKLIVDWLKTIPNFSCDASKRGRDTSAGKRFIDAIICDGATRIGIEIKKGDSRYGGLQEAKDLLLVEKEFTHVIVVRLKTFAEFMGR